MRADRADAAARSRLCRAEGLARERLRGRTRLYGTCAARGGSLRPDCHGAVRSGRAALEVGAPGVDEDGPGRSRSGGRAETDRGVDRLDGRRGAGVAQVIDRFVIGKEEPTLRT